MPPNSVNPLQTEPGLPAQEFRGRVELYLLLLAIQSAGAAIVLANGTPIYRQMASDFESHHVQSGVVWWVVAAIALIQVAYWLRVRLDPPLPQRGHVFIGHLAQFVARLSFILVSSSFALMFLVRFQHLSLPPRRTVLVLALLFSMFCWTLELERLARALYGTKAQA